MRPPNSKRSQIAAGPLLFYGAIVLLMFIVTVAMLALM